MRHPVSRIALSLAIVALALMPAAAQPKPKAATLDDIERLEKKLDEQRVLVGQLVRLQQQYLQALVLVLTGDHAGAVAAATDGEPRPQVVPAATRTEPKPTKRTEPKPAAGAAPKKPDKAGFGTLVGQVKGGAGEAIVYVDLPAPAVSGTATMKQEGKQFMPRVLVVQKGTRVDFPNLDAVFHNVFSVTPDSSFDLGSYRQGESKSVALAKPGVVTVYCNMHPNMVGHILVVPSALHIRTGSDGFFKLPNVPAGKHKIVAWAPNAKPTSVEVEVADGEASTVALEVVRRGATPHLNKDGQMYGSYKD